MTDKSWIEEEGALVRTFSFDSYLDGAAFVSRIATLAEARQHHPEVLLGYKTVTVETTTHDAGRTVTEKDRRLAQDIDGLFVKRD